MMLFVTVVSCVLLWSNKKISVLRVTGLKILGRSGTHIFFLEKILIILCILKGISPSKMHKIIFSPENLKKILGSPVNLGRVELP